MRRLAKCRSASQVRDRSAGRSYTRSAPSARTRWTRRRQKILLVRLSTRRRRAPRTRASFRPHRATTATLPRTQRTGKSSTRPCSIWQCAAVRKYERCSCCPYTRTLSAVPSPVPPNSPISLRSRGSLPCVVLFPGNPWSLRVLTILAPRSLHAPSSPHSSCLHREELAHHFSGATGEARGSRGEEERKSRERERE